MADLKPTAPLSASLLELLSQSAHLIDYITSNGGEIPLELEKELQTLAIDQAAKIDAYHACLEQLKLQGDYFRQKSREFLKIAVSLELAEERIKSGLKETMMIFNKIEIQGQDVRFKIANSPPKLVVEDLLSIPDDYQIIRIEFDHPKIKKDLTEGIKVPGCHLEQGVSLRSYPNLKNLKGKSSS